MKRICLCLACLGLVAAAGEVQTAGAQQFAPRPAPQVEPRPVPPPAARARRYKVSSFGVWVRTTAPNGQPAYRYTYRGQVYGDIPPAIFTYGYEHTYQDNGPNTLNGPWH